MPNLTVSQEDRQDTIAAVTSSIQANPRVSTHNLSAQLGVSRRSLQRIIYDDLNLFPYKVQITSRLNPLDLLIYCLEFCQKIIAKAEEDNHLINCLVMSDDNNPQDGTSPRTSHCVVRSFIKVYCRYILL